MQIEKQNKGMRKGEFRLYPSKPQLIALKNMLVLHARLYNALLEQRQHVWKSHKKGLSFRSQCKEITKLREEMPEFENLNAQSLQVTAKRLDLAFQAFFRRLAGGETPGYPRFKATNSYSGWGYKSHGDGWKLNTWGVGKAGKRTGELSLSGVGMLRIRGRIRNAGAPKTMEILHRNGNWYASVTFDCPNIERDRGDNVTSLDWGVATFVTKAKVTSEKWEEAQVSSKISLADIAFDEVKNPRHLQKVFKKLIVMQKNLSRKKIGSNRRSKTKAKLARVHQKVTYIRDDFLHKEAAKNVADSKKIITESLDVVSMTEKGKSKRKRTRNRNILDTAPGKYLQLLESKASEAGCGYTEINTRKEKPSQTCPACRHQRKKEISERIHICAECGFTLSRDRAATVVMLLAGTTWKLKLSWQRGIENLSIQRAGGRRRTGRNAKAVPVSRETPSVSEAKADDQVE